MIFIAHIINRNPSSAHFDDDALRINKFMKTKKFSFMENIFVLPKITYEKVFHLLPFPLIIIFMYL